MMNTHNVSFNYGDSILNLQECPNVVAIDVNQNSDIKKHKQQAFLQIENFWLFEQNQWKSLNTGQSFSTSKVYRLKDEKKEQFLVPEKTIYIEFLPEVTEAQRQTFLEKNQLTPIEEIDEHSCMVNIPKDCDPLELSIDLQQNCPLLETAEPELIAPTYQFEFVLPTDELLSKQWYMENRGVDVYDGTDSWKYRKGADAKIIEAWKILSENNTGWGANTTIAIIDRGFDLSHPDFEGKIVAQRDFRYEEEGRVGRAFPVELDPFSNDGSTIADHGTSCAGIALAQSNGKGIVGVAPEAKFMPIRYNSASARSLRKMFKHIMKNGGDIISCSFGTHGTGMNRATQKVIKRCATKGRNGKGCVICFATGNSYSILKSGETATHPDIIAVGASTSEDTYAPYSNRTKNMSVVAPGGYGHSGLMTTSDAGFFDNSTVHAGTGDEASPYYTNKAQGTSFACPLVAGVCALILSAYPDLTAREVRDILEKTADKIGSPSEYDTNGRSVKYGFGRVNAANAVIEALNRKRIANTDEDEIIEEIEKIPFLKSEVNPPDVSAIPNIFELILGTTQEYRMGQEEEEVFITIPVSSEDTGNRLYLELDADFDIAENAGYVIYAGFNEKPGLLPETHIAKSSMGHLVELEIENLQAGDYILMVKCFNPSIGGWAKNAGSFELTHRIIDINAEHGGGAIA